MKKRPNALWLFFYGRRRRGFPWLLVAVAAVIVFFGFVFAIPGGADASRGAGPAILFGLLFLGAVLFAVYAIWRPRRRP